jgi:hypothetical protein
VAGNENVRLSGDEVSEVLLAQCLTPKCGWTAELTAPLTHQEYAQLVASAMTHASPEPHEFMVRKLLR